MTVYSLEEALNTETLLGKNREKALSSVQKREMIQRLVDNYHSSSIERFQTVTVSEWKNAYLFFYFRVESSQRVNFKSIAVK